VVGTHIFLSPIAGTDASHPCVYNDTYCITSNYAPVGYLDGAGIWDALKDIAGLRAIFTGHSHSGLQRTDDWDETEISFRPFRPGTSSYGGWGNIILNEVQDGQSDD